MMKDCEFLIDQPIEVIEKDIFQVHSLFAQSLLTIIEKCKTPFSIGIFGGWGTGKTTITKILEKLVREKNHLWWLYFDVWKFSKEPLKRWMLFEAVRQLSEQEQKKGFKEENKKFKEYKFEDRTLKSILEYEEVTTSETKSEIDTKAAKYLISVAGGVFLFSLLLFILPYVLPIISQSIPKLNFLKDTQSLKNFLDPTGGIFLSLSFVIAIFKTAIQKLLENLSKAIFMTTMKSTKQQPAFSAEKFQEIFREFIFSISAIKQQLKNKANQFNQQQNIANPQYYKKQLLEKFSIDDVANSLLEIIDPNVLWDVDLGFEILKQVHKESKFETKNFVKNLMEFTNFFIKERLEQRKELLGKITDFIVQDTQLNSEENLINVSAAYAFELLKQDKKAGAPMFKKFIPFLSVNENNSYAKDVVNRLNLLENEGYKIYEHIEYIDILIEFKDITESYFVRGLKTFIASLFSQAKEDNEKEIGIRLINNFKSIIEIDSDLKKPLKELAKNEKFKEKVSKLLKNG